jgi:hypothetical protein
MTIECPNCRAENPDHVMYCGKCATQLTGYPTPEAGDNEPLHKRPAEQIESILSRNLLRIEQNVVKKRKGLSGMFGGKFLRFSTLAFKSEFEEVTLSIDKDGHASVSKGHTSTHTILLAGSHDSFLKMFQDERNVSMIPDSITIHLGNREFPHNISERVLRELVERFLQKLFE